VKIVTAYRRKENKNIKNNSNMQLWKKQLYLVNHYYSAKGYVKTAEYKKIENAFQHEDVLLVKLKDTIL
jgi:hypothetical protein